MKSFTHLACILWHNSSSISVWHSQHKEYVIFILYALETMCFPISWDCCLYHVLCHLLDHDSQFEIEVCRWASFRVFIDIIIEQNPPWKFPCTKPLWSHVMQLKESLTIILHNNHILHNKHINSYTSGFKFDVYIYLFKFARSLPTSVFSWECA